MSKYASRTRDGGGQRVRGGDGRGSPVVSRRILLAAGGAAPLTSTAAAAAADARAHGPGTQPHPAPNAAADPAGGTSGTRASISSGPGEARAAASPSARQHSAPARQHPASARPATRLPRPQPRLPYGEPMSTPSRTGRGGRAYHRRRRPRRTRPRSCGSCTGTGSPRRSR